MGFHHGLSGLNASSKNLDVIGHNIANSNTVGFKHSRAEFNEMVASAMGTSGSNNAGTGVSVAAVSQQFTQGVTTPSANGLDMAIEGDGFFVVQTGTGVAYTRNGAFQLNKAGELITVNKDKVQGYTLDPDTGLRTSTSLTNLVFPTGMPIPAKETSTVTATLNLDARVDQDAIPAPPRATYGTSLEVFDAQGMATPLPLYFEKTGPNTWDVYSALDQPGPPPVIAAPVGTLVFDAQGKLQTPAPGTTLPILVATQNPNAPDPGPWTVNVNVDGISQLGSKFSVAKLTQDGYASGELTSVNVASDGTLMATYSNGVTRAEAQIALAKFTNNQGLQPDGNNNWVASNDSGPPVYGTAGTGSFGIVAGNKLEESTVDLTAQLVGMMTAQRAYQANAQTIKTQDQIFSTLVNLR